MHEVLCGHGFSSSDAHPAGELQRRAVTLFNFVKNSTHVPLLSLDTTLIQAVLIRRVRMTSVSKHYFLKFIIPFISSFKKKKRKKERKDFETFRSGGGVWTEFLGLQVLASAPPTSGAEIIAFGVQATQWLLSSLAST